MSRHHKKLIASLPKHPEYTPEVPNSETAEESPSAWIVLEDRNVCVRGAITKIRQGKIIKDRPLAELVVAQGAKLQVHNV
jgi:hypothetical protein